MDRKVEQQLTYKEWEKQHNQLIAFLKERVKRLFETRDSFNLMLRVGLKKKKTNVQAQVR